MAVFKYEPIFDFEDKNYSSEEGDGQDNQPISVLHGCLPDQAALIGVLNALYHARYPLLVVRYLRSEELIQAHHVCNN